LLCEGVEGGEEGREGGRGVIFQKWRLVVTILEVG
jgi:hypothetical protein